MFNVYAHTHIFIYNIYSITHASGGGLVDEATDLSGDHQDLLGCRAKSGGGKALRDIASTPASWPTKKRGHGGVGVGSILR